MASSDEGSREIEKRISYILMTLRESALEKKERGKCVIEVLNALKGGRWTQLVENQETKFFCE